MISDYFLVRNTELDVDDLYTRDGAYSFTGGYNFIALVALVAATAPLVPGFFNTLTAPLGFGALSAVQGTLGFTVEAVATNLFDEIYQWSWFVAFFTAGGVYWLGMKVKGTAVNPSLSKATS